jgi:hypothetical protein
MNWTISSRASGITCGSGHADPSRRPTG